MRLVPQDNRSTSIRDAERKTDLEASQTEGPHPAARTPEERLLQHALPTNTVQLEAPSKSELPETPRSNQVKEPSLRLPGQT
ncbi:MAG TPA: hypothetical protein VGO47_00945, partial [Chlamydiales bacterium]|nr:hypothetical protein [Chlamydiales bacterium]